MPSGAQAAVGELTSVLGGDDNEQTRSLKWMFSAQTFTSRNFPGSETGIGFLAIPIMVLAGTPADHLRRPAGMPHTSSEESQGSRARGGQGPGWVCEKSLYEDQGMTNTWKASYLIL